MNIKKVLIVSLATIGFIILVLSTVYFYFTSSINSIVNEVYESNGNYHSEHVLDSVVKYLNPRNNLKNNDIDEKDVEKEEFSVSDFIIEPVHKQIEYTYSYSAYGQDNLIYNTSRKISLKIEFDGINWIIVNCKEIQ
ncbi:MAG: hypothetical protein ACI4Q8_03865 [Ruminococcus sp.]